MADDAAGLVRGLERAAELEHAVLLQYLFAAASLKRRVDEGVSLLELERIRGWERTLLAIAREEMAHLAAVSNLLIAVGASPWLVRPGLPGGRLAAGEPALALERFGPSSLARFVALERDGGSPGGDGAIAGAYAAIRRELVRLDAAGCLVVRVAPVDRVDGWGVSGEARFPPVTDVASALAVIDAVVGQGAGGGGSHLARLLEIEVDLAGRPAGFDPARAVLSDPVVGATVVDPATVPVASAFAAAYQATMLLLELYYAGVERGSGAATRIRRVVQGLMSGVLRPLGEVLTELPVGDAAPGWSCGPVFAWEPGSGVAALLTGAAAALATAVPGGPARLGLIRENLVLAAGLAGGDGG